ncbi:inactive protein kinase SELMODRAFT_444075-like isoform X2 [Tripterygium wilfordii]|uniref:inactive protein kinase SELMODRAFT_444075-like isoform X2 n=1 Tax=Tripterygium wilfordii TaxID=458696 RepID=UPI0018F825A7|nr:inactive protein kinase SELMODRAFT_444075-like isoform X2 [Tripterygium wilfordii]
MFLEVSEDSQRQRSAGRAVERVVVAVKAEKVIARTALAWALTHVVDPGDCITLLAVFSSSKSSKRFWNIPWLTGDCSSSHRQRFPDRICEISESCSQMVLQFHNQPEVRVRIKVVSGMPGDAVAAEARRCDANWVVLDKTLKQEVIHCVEELCCNVVVMKGSQAKVLKLNLGCSDDNRPPYLSACSSPDMDMGMFYGHGMKHSTPVSSPEEPISLYTRTTREGSLSSIDTISSPFLVCEQNPLFEGPRKVDHTPPYDQKDFNGLLAAVNSDGKKILTQSMNQTSTNGCKSVLCVPRDQKVDDKPPRTLLDNFLQYDKDTRAGRTTINQSPRRDYIANSSIRDAVSLGRTSSVPPPLCSLCQNMAPAFGKPPRQFSYEDLEEATDGFSDSNCLAEGGFGKVYQGTLRDGLFVAVKLLKTRGSQADTDFCSEVRVLSCAQHRNLVLLIGFCIDGNKRILVYEYICNRSLDYQLHGNKRNPLDCHSRLKIAIGTARGLRYLHEDCRVGCIVHRDMRPNNILLTHDFEPLVADFGLARWYSDRNCNIEESVIGTSGYLAPEYVYGGKITEKVDVYAFGVVLLELMTGQRISELQLYKERQFISERWHTHDAFEPSHIIANIHHLLDPCLVHQEHDHFIQNMGHAASLCLQRDPESRPPMSKVLKLLEGGDLVVPIVLDLNSVGSRSGHLHGLSSYTPPEARGGHSRRLSH